MQNLTLRPDQIELITEALEALDAKYALKVLASKHHKNRDRHMSLKDRLNDIHELHIDIAECIGA